MIGLHFFFNPVPVLPLVEVVRSIMTSEETLERARRSREETSAGRRSTRQDRAGFVVNALLIPYLLSAIRMYESGLRLKEDIDEGMMKPRAPDGAPVLDLIGLDTLLAVAQSLHDEFRSRLGGPRPAEPDGRGRPARPEVRPRLLRLQLLTVTGLEYMRADADGCTRRP